MRRVIVLITGTYQLLQSLWYCSKFPNNDYTAVLKLADNSLEVREQLTALCINSKVFSRVMEYNGTSIDSSLLQKGKLLLSMVFHYITGTRETLTAKMIRKAIGDLSYDQVIVDSELSILGGAFIDHADEIDTIIMQEGLSDILPRHTRLRRGRHELSGFLLARMGYCTPAIIYPLPKLKYCRKMTSMGTLLACKEYKEQISLFSDSCIDNYQKVLERTFTKFNTKECREAGAILITSPLDKIGGTVEHYLQIYDWLKKHCSGQKIIIKKHPRDTYAYQWDDLDLSFVEASIPAELLLSQVADHQRVLMAFISTCIVDILDSKVSYSIFRFDSIQRETYNEAFENIKTQLRIGDERIIHV